MKKSPVVSFTVVTRDGDKLSRPMATYITDPSQREVIRARDTNSGQGGWRETMVLLSQHQPQRPASLPDHVSPDPVLNHDFLAGVIAGASATALVVGVIYLGGVL